MSSTKIEDLLNVIGNDSSKIPIVKENAIDGLRSKARSKVLKPSNSSLYLKTNDSELENLSNGSKNRGKWLGNMSRKTKNFIVNTSKSVAQSAVELGENTYKLLKPSKNVIINQNNIQKIKSITSLIKNDCIYIDITNLIRGYELKNNIKYFKYFTEDPLLNIILYSIISNNKDNKNKIIYFKKNHASGNYIHVYNVNEQIEYKPIRLS